VIETELLCERCLDTRAVQQPGYQRWLTADTPADPYIVRAVFSVRYTDGREPALCVACLRLAIADALVSLRAQAMDFA
jgi:hypothetical protein